MAAITPPTPSSQVVPSWMWPTTATSSEASAKKLEAEKAAHETRAREYRTAAGQLGELTEGAFSEEAILQHQRMGVDYDNAARICGAYAKAERESAKLAHDLAAALDNIDYEAQQRLSSTPPAGRAAIIAQAQADATSTLGQFAAAVEQAQRRAEAEASPLVSGIRNRAPAPTDKDNTTQALDNGLERRRDTGGDSRAGNSGSEDHGSSGAASGGLDQRAGPSVESAQGEGPTSTTDTTADGLEHRGSYSESPLVGPGSSMPTPRPSSPPSPLSSGGIGGLPGASGGGMPGGLSGIGSGNPVSSLASGAGGVSGSTTPSGLPGVPAGPSAGGVPASGVGDQFARGVSAGSGAAGVVSPMSSTPPPMMGPAAPPSASSAPAAPVAGAGSAPSAAPAGLAGSGAHTPAPAAPPPAATGGAVGAPGSGMMLPAPGMGAPAAPGGVVTPGSSTPATMLGSGSGSAGSGASVGAGAAATPTLLPAGVATPVAAATRQAKTLSRDARDAAAGAWALGRACGDRGYPVSWAVGVFRSSTSSETVVMSSEGSGYVPEGVYLPRSVRLMVADPLVDSEFRSRWFGWADPGEVLVEYAALRRADDWTLVAAATTARVDAFRRVGNVEYVAVDPYVEPGPEGIPAGWKPPSLDDMHVHRLALEYPDLYGRLVTVASAGSSTLNERVMFPLTQWVMRVVPHLDEYPSEFRPAWRAVEANAEKDWPAWESYRTAYSNFAMRVGASAPGGTGGVGDELRPEDVPVETHQLYRDKWKVARAMELLLGWSQSPLPLADMVYAAAVSGLVDIREALSEKLGAVEEDLRA
jgi:hypothetical protein